MQIRAAMKIRRLEITGFKSFADRVVFSFDEGVTGVVGPNGCGKSNVVDAIRWAMGEQSAKHLRGRSMEDVIFAGSESRPATGMAEVALTFQNDGRSAPAQYAGYSEITVTRRLFRNGESDYAINKTPCRLLDITELFLGTGVGTRAYSIIEQGRIGLIVSAKPEDRRSILEEAAGVTKYKARRKQAERKLDATEQNLLRLSDVVGEVGKRLQSLERAAKKAERFRELRQELREFELLVAAQSYLEAKFQEAAHAEELREASDAEKVAQAHVARLEAGLSAERLALLEDEKKVQSLSEGAHQIDKQVKLAEQEAQFAQRERESIAARQAQHEDELSLLGIRLEHLTREEEGQKIEQQKLVDATAEDQARQAQAEATLQESQAQIKAAQTAVEEERHQAVSVLTQLANHRTNLVNLEKRRSDLTARMTRVQTESDELAAKAQEISRQRDELAQTLLAAQEKRRELHDQRVSHEELLQRTRAELRETEAMLIRLREELADRRSRLTSLLELQKNFEGYGRGQKAILMREEDERRRDGIYGLLADALRTAPQHERAIEAVLGDRLQLVLVESHAAGLRAIEYLKKASAGRASFVPLTEMEQLPLPTGADGNELAAPEGAIRAIDVVDCAPEHERLKRFLLADVFLVDTLATALALWSRNPGARTFVSTEGEVVDKEGVVSGGQLEGVGGGLLHKRRELQELAELVRELEAKMSLSTLQVNELAARVSATEVAAKRFAQEERDEELNQLRLERDVARLQEELGRHGQRDAVLRTEKETLGNALSEVAREETDARDAVSTREGEQLEREARLRSLQAELLRARERAEGVQAEVTRAKVNAAALAERREGIARSLLRLEEQRREVESRREKLDAEIAQGKERAAALEEKTKVSHAQLSAMLKESEELREQLGRARVLYETAQSKLRGGDDEVRAARGESNKVGERRSAADLALQTIRLEIGHLEQSVREKHLMEIADVSEARREEAEKIDRERAEEQMTRLRERIEALGEVSLTAIDEAKEVGDRHAFLTAQKIDLEESIAKLRSAINRIDRASKERFKETFHLVNERFQQVFPRLFRGGAAELQLVEDPANPGGEPGVEIVAQPPGKKLTSVGLLSGGEKALTAVSLIFAIFLIKPTPFCLLDEVDAPLDEANVGRYNEMVREMSRTSQFIVITHNKRTMEIADSLYGVTMEEPGISKTVSVKLSPQAQGGTTVAA